MSKPIFPQFVLACLLAICFVLAPQVGLGSTLSNAADSLAPGAWVEISTQNFNDDLLVINASEAFEYSDTLKWDPVLGEVHFTGSGHQVEYKHLVYNEASNSWSSRGLPSAFTTGHAYDHLAIDPVSRRYFSRGFNSSRLEIYNLDNRSWTRSSSVSGLTQVAGGITWSPELNRVLWLDERQGVLAYNVGNDQWTTLVSDSQVSGIGKYHNFAERSPLNGTILMGGGNNSRVVYKMTPAGQVTRVDDAPVSIGMTKSVVTVDPVGGNFLVVGSNGRLYEYDLGSDSWQLLPGSVPSELMGGAPGGSWNLVATPIDTHGVVFFAKHNSGNSVVYLYRHSNGIGTPPPEPLPNVTLTANPSVVASGAMASLSWTSSNADSCTASGAWSGSKSVAGSANVGPVTSASTYTLVCTNAQGNGSDSATVSVNTSTGDGDADWLARSTAPGVLMATRFDTLAEVTESADDGNVSWDQVNARSGNGSLRMDILKTDSTLSGEWVRYLSDDQRKFEPGDEFYVQFSQYIPEYMISHVFRGSQYNGGTVSQGFKSAIISHYPNSNTNFEVVLQNSGQFGYPQGYHQDGVSTAIKWSSSKSTACAGSDFVHQPAIDHGPQSGTPDDGSGRSQACRNDAARYGGLYSAYNDGHIQRGLPDPLTGAVTYPLNDWITFLQRIRISPNGYGSGDSTLETWAATPATNGEYVLLSSNSNVKLGGGGRFDALWLLNYRSKGSSDSSRQDTFTLYDEVIVSENFIPAPGLSSGPGLPIVTLSAAQNTIASGNSTTLSWSAANADSCTASGGWSGPRPISGNESTGSLTSPTTFTLLCSGPGGDASRAVTVNIGGGDTGAYDLHFNSSGHSGGTPLDGASVSGSQWIYVTPESNISSVEFYLDDPEGTGSPFRVESIGPYDFGGSAAPYDTTQLSNGTHTISARINYSGSGNDLISAEFQLNNNGGGGGEPPTVNLTAAPSSIAFGATSTLIWSSNLASTCVASGDWSGSRPTSGSEVVGPLTQNSVFFLSCTGTGGTDIQSVAVAVTPAPVQSLNLSAAPQTIEYNGFTSVIWSGSNVDACVASGDWSGAKPTSGSQSFGPLTDNAVYSLDCTGPGGSISRTVNVTVNPAAGPTLTLTATPDSVAFGGATTLAWSTTNATSCTASGTWSGSRSTSGNETYGPLNEDATFSMSCSGPGGSVNQAVSVSVSPPAPTVNLTATPLSIESGGTSTLSWSTEHADSCTASGAWSGTRANSGSELVGPLSADSTFALICSGAGGNDSDVVTVFVAAVGAPTVNFDATPAVITVGDSTTLNWSSTNADECTAAGDWSGSKTTSGSEIVGPLTSDASYSLTCTGAAGAASWTVNVSVTQPAPVITMSATPDSVDHLGNTTLTWSTENADTCSAFGSWAGSRATSGSETTGPLEGDAIFRLTCAGDGGTATQIVTVAVAPPVSLEVSLSVSPQNLPFGGSATLTWDAPGADGCTAFGAWSGAQASSGTFDTGALTQNTTYALSCSGPGGQDAAAVTVLVDDPAAPTITFSAADVDLGYGQGTTLTWSVTDAESCAAAGNWTGDRPSSGTEATGELFTNSAYVLTCVGDGGVASQTVAIIVADPPGMEPQTFANDAVGSDPVDWFDTGLNFDLDENDNLFEVVSIDGNRAMGTPVFNGQNAHSHYVAAGSADWRNYRYTGRMRLDDNDGQIGVTVFSGYPQTDEYYRFAYVGPEGTFRLQARGDDNECTGTSDTGVQPAGGTWYRFMIEVADNVSSTDLRAKVWAEGATEPGWQAQCSDEGPRRRTGTVGLWTSMIDDLDARAWDDLMVAPLNVPANPPPVVTLMAEPPVVGIGQSSTLIWAAENADSCVASGAWSGSRAQAGVEVVGPLDESASFTLTCTGLGGSFSASTAVLVMEIDVISLTFTADTDVVGNGGSVTLQWEAQNAQVCAAADGWSGIRPTSGTETIFDITANTDFTLKCFSPNGFVTKVVSVSVDSAAGPPLIDLVADVSGLALQNNVLLEWETAGASSCTASGDWSGSKPMAGQESVGPIVTQHTFVLTCVGPGGVSFKAIALSYVDEDEDGLVDVWEFATFGNLDQDGTGDADGDGLLDRDEFLNGTNPHVADTDGDGESDYEEVIYGSDALNIGSTWRAHRPLRPVVLASGVLPLWGAVIDISGAYVDPDGDPLGYAEWQLSVNPNFSSATMDRDIEGLTRFALPGGIMQPGTRYFARTRHWDNTGIPSEWSLVGAFRSDFSYPNDADGNGTDDDDQVDGFADSNGNGVDDHDEGICNLYDAAGNSIIGLKAMSGDIQCFRSLGTADVPASELPAADLPYGMFSFRVTGLPINVINPASVDVQIYFPVVLDPDFGWYKHDPSAGGSFDFSEHITVSGNMVTLRLVDGGAGDQDGVVNGIIVDPSGPAPAVSTPRPGDNPPPAPTGGDSSGGGGGGAAGVMMLMLLSGLYAGRRRGRRYI